MDALRKLLPVLLLACLSCFSQEEEKIRVLERQIESTQVDSTKISLLIQLGALKDSIELLEQAEALSNSINSSEYKLKVLSAKSALYRKLHQYDQQSRNDSLYRNFARNVGNSEHEIKATINQAMDKDRTGDYVAALRIFNEALELAQKSKNDTQIGRSYEGISMVFSRQYNYDEALKYAFLAAEHYAKGKNYLNLVSINHLLAICYHNKNDLINAEKYYLKSNELAIKHGYKIQEAANYSHLAYIYKENDIKKGLEYQLKAQAIFEKENKLHYNSIQNLGNLGETYSVISTSDSLQKIANLSKKAAQTLAKKYILNAIDYARQTNEMNNYLENLNRLSRLEYQENKYKEAYDHFRTYFTLQDSIFSQENKNKLAKLESQKEIELRDKEIEVSEIRLGAQKKQQVYLITGIALLAIIGGMLLYQNNTRRKNNKKLRVLNQELDESNKVKARFFGILNHDLRSPVANLIHFLHLKKENPEMLSEENKTRLEQKTISAAENLLISMEDILLWSKGQMDNFKPNFKKIEVKELFNDISKHFGSEERVAIRFENPEQISVHTDEDYLKTIMRNLTGNAIKALTAIENPQIVWNAREEYGKVQLSITDNGAGGSDEKFRALYDDSEVVGIKTGLGLHLIRDLAKAINCEIDLLSEIGKGTTIILKFS